MTTCANCGTTKGKFHKHHIHGRKVSDETTELCSKCHSEHHNPGIVIIKNAAAKAALAEVAELEKTRFVGKREILSLLEKHGYKPKFDWEPEDDDPMPQPRRRRRIVEL